MSNEEAEEIMDAFEKKWNAKHKHDFIDRMERKLNRKERLRPPITLRNESFSLSCRPHRGVGPGMASSQSGLP